MQTYMDQIVQAVVGLLVSVVLVIIASLRAKVSAWLEARTTASQRDTLHKLAAEAAALAEATYETLDGPAKLNKAIQYVIDKSPVPNLDIVTIRAAVEKAVLDYNTKIKGGGAVAGSDGA